MDLIIGNEILNFIGATIRWIYGTAVRTILKKPKYTFKEYLRGPKNSKDWFDKTAHEFNNKWIALAFIGIVISLIVRFT